MKKIVYIALVLCLFTACRKKTNDEPAGPPAAATLLSPASNSTCTTGVVVSNTTSTVSFTWTMSDNTQSYDLNIKNLLTGVSIVQTVTVPQAQVNLDRNTPYSWFVVSKSSQNATTAQSSVWKFYNSGIATTSYAPFPADLTSPVYGQSVTAIGGRVTLSWNGSAVGNNIIGYDVYIGTGSSTLSLVSSNQVPATYAATVISGVTYYWNVVTKDSNGNTSTSVIGQFKVN